MDMGGNPCLLLFIDERFDKSILAVGHDTDKDPRFGNLTGIRINDLCRIASPVNLDLLACFSRDVHSSAPLLLVLLNVIAELGIHQSLITILTAFFKVFRPEELLVDTIFEQFLTDVVEVRHPLSGFRRQIFWKHPLLQLGIGE